MAHINYSDDGDRNFERSHTEDLALAQLLNVNQRNSTTNVYEREMSASVTAAISEHRMRH